MSATDKLRHILDELGVEWHKGKFPSEERTYWQGVVARPWTEQRLQVRALLTPEQAIAATLGHGICHIREHKGDWICDACNNEVASSDPTSELYTSGNAIELWEFCPYCGARVVR